jgi:metal-responsive CopG/Arc/MetJ family transcriptional regulator
MISRSKLSITLTNQLLDKIDDERNLVSKSAYVEHALRKYFKMDMSGVWRQRDGKGTNKQNDNT